MLTAIFLGFNVGGFFLPFGFSFFSGFNFGDYFIQKTFFSMAAIFLTFIVGYSNPHQKNWQPQSTIRRSKVIKFIKLHLWLIFNPNY
jgi:hypothetical protein